jgi:hypothetical protein
MASSKQTVFKFSAKIDIIGINPFVFVPPRILENIFEQARKTKGHIPVKGTINTEPYKQTLVKYSGEWRLYINTTMLKNSPKRVGERIALTIAYDDALREIRPPGKFIVALNKDSEAKKVFASLSPGLKKEIARYLSALKTEESLNRNIDKAINFLKGNGRFVGREINTRLQ